MPSRITDWGMAYHDTKGGKLLDKVNLQSYESFYLYSTIYADPRKDDIKFCRLKCITLSWKQQDTAKIETRYQERACFTFTTYSSLIEMYYLYLIERRALFWKHEKQYLSEPVSLPASFFSGANGCSRTWCLKLYCIGEMHEKSMSGETFHRQ